MATEIREGMCELTNPMKGDNPPRVQEQRISAETVAGGSIAETIGGAAAVVLAIVGLANIYPSWMAAISAIALGAALLLRGAAVAARYSWRHG